LSEQRSFALFFLYLFSAQVRPKSDKMRSVHLQFLPETMNRCWAESDEAAMLAVHRRNRQVNESKLKFQVSSCFYLIYNCRPTRRKCRIGQCKPNEGDLKANGRRNRCPRLCLTLPDEVNKPIVLG